MTIRFLKPWNGYQPDAVVTGLTNEATLIAGGLASADLDGGNDGRTYEAKLSTDASAGYSSRDNRNRSGVWAIIKPATGWTSGAITINCGRIAVRKVEELSVV